MNKKFYFTVAKELIYSDLIVFKQIFFDKFIDLTIWVVLTIVVMGYIMPFFGLSRDFGVFQLAGVIASVGLFELYANVVDLVSDFEGDRVINYSLTLPIPSWLAIISKATYYGIIYFILALIMFPIGKLCLWNQLDLTQISYFKLLLALIFQSIFYACFVLWTSSIIATITKLGSVWARFIFPMWFMGGFQFSWVALYTVLPPLALINLLNPMIYLTEATRAAILGQTGYINFWLCLLAVLILSALCLLIGMRNLKKRLDFV
jgi:ABC-type polysaccharide/polyol phosphate export permease